MRKTVFLSLILLSGPVRAEPAVVTRLDEIIRGEHIDRPGVLVRGTVVDVLPDSIDTNFVHVFLTDGRSILSAAFTVADISRPLRARLPNAEVEVAGYCRRNFVGWRRRSGPFVSGESLRILKEAPADPFDVPPIESLEGADSGPLLKYARYRVDGQVRAVREDGTVIVETPGGLSARVNLRDQAPPRFGERIRAVGSVDTDTANILLAGAIWRPEAGPEVPAAAAVELTAEHFKGDITYTRLDGKLVTVTAVVRDVTPRRLVVCLDDTVLRIESGTVEDAFVGLPNGATVRATGVFLVDTEAWSRRTPFPRITGSSLVLRTAADLEVLARPSRWTPRRLAALVGLLLAGLLAVLVWNRILQRVVEKRGRQLAEESLAHVESALRIGERTRLAVELHDSVAQVLTGVAMEVNAARRLVRAETAKAELRLTLASKSLASCREELRNCIWDLRNLALDESDVNDAIRRTLRPHLGRTKLTVRFNVPRDRLSDNATHAFLCIIRELSVNAIRHGGATELRVAGAIEGETLLFSVADNGCGFDPQDCCGPEEGHFGLQGIRERVKGFGGTFDIARSGDAGMRAVIAIRIPSGKRP